MLSARPLNRLQSLLPEGLLVDSAWMTRHGYSTALRSQYAAAGWLHQPVRRVYRRRRGTLLWQHAVVSLQTLLDTDLVVGGRTALELQGFAHYLRHEAAEVHLCGPQKPPTWLDTLPVAESFHWHNSTKLFSAADSPVDLPWAVDWTLKVSSPERALLELLDELPGAETFEQVDRLMEGLTNLRPRRLEKLLVDCRSVKVKRLFFYFADRHRHAWLRHVNKENVDLGAGKRHLVPGGKLDPVYLITVPRDLDGVS